MKSEHRHELQTNDLGKLVHQAEPYLETYGVKALVIGGVLLVLVIGYSAWKTSQTSQEAEAWTRLAAANSTEDFENVYDEFPGTNVADWALIHAAESHLQSGVRNSFTDRSAGTRDLTDAKEQFQKLLDSSSTRPEIRERALFGLARTEESMSDGDLKNATELYKKLIQEFPDSIFRKLAEQRVKPVDGEKVAALEEEGTKNFYKWFHEQSPKPGDRQQPGFNMPLPGMTPGGAGNDAKQDLPGLPDLPDLPSLPGLPEPLTNSPQTDDAKSDAPKTETPKTDAPAKAEPKSADKPAAPEEPAKKTEAPAEKPSPEPATEKKP
ncbi:tetratricopeptide repeat protein [Gimesia maris]|uniref:tetratricopeptide repeat protein n=1 Tax=Gimesia maris TaxID=122 RepID=UPI00241D2F0C|nr:hypothetical protein [Gimesia maris]|tara:strand:+ start:23900 stop:24868 length:969 start_codon:yes stop_codon:yes gene_type:complete